MKVFVLVMDNQRWDCPSAEVFMTKKSAESSMRDILREIWEDRREGEKFPGSLSEAQDELGVYGNILECEVQGS